MTTLLDPLFKEISDGICVSDSSGNILYINPAAERMLDLNGTAGKVKICDHLCGHLAVSGGGDCASKCPLRQPGSAERSVTFHGRYGPKMTYEWRATNFNRTERWNNLRVRCLRMPTILFDSWEMEKHFTLIEDASAEMELERRKEDWRSMVAHDLRNPLTNIYASLKTLEEIPAGRALQDQDKHFLQISIRACRRITEMLDLFLELSQFEAGSVPVRLENISVRDTVKRCVEEQSAFAQSRKIEIGTAVPEALTARADADLLIRVMQNLLGNALKFTPEGGRVLVSAAADSGGVRLRVKDTGPGIPPEHLPFIFDRFYQARARREGKIQGNGLGLAFCREALKAMGGGIEVESTPGKGSEFAVRLQAWTAAPKAQAPQTEHLLRGE